MPWVKKNAGVLLDDNLTAYLDTLASQLPFSITVTSGIRTAKEQAQAMYKKIELGEDLKDTYKDKQFAQDMMNAYPDLSKGVAIVELYFKNGGGSSHQRNMGLDLRTYDKTPEQVQTMIDIVRSMGDFALYEPTPPHLHITLKKNYKRTRSKVIPLLVLLGVAWMAI